MLKNSKLSNRFKKPEEIVKVEEVEEVETVPQPVIAENDEIKESLLEKIQSVPVWADFAPEKQKEMIKTFLNNKLENSENIELLADELHKSVSGFGALQNLIDNNNISAVFVNGINNVYVESLGRVLNTEIKLSQKEFDFILNNILAGKSFDSGIINLKKDGLMINIIQPSNISIRKVFPVNADILVQKGFATKEIIDFLKDAVDKRKNIVISGGINSGKTTFLNVLMTDKRSVLFEETEQITSDFDDLMRFGKPDDALVSSVIKLLPEYIFADLNRVAYIEYNGLLQTLRASSVEESFKKLVFAYIATYNLSEKFARIKVLTDIDYIVQLDNGCKIASVVELTPAKTLPLSIKQIFKL